MGLDIYSYIMVGVPACNYITHEIEVQKIVRYNNHTGEPYEITKEVDNYFFQRNVYIDLYEIESMLKRAGLSFVSFDYSSVGKQDTIGIKICDNSNEGGKKYDTNMVELAEKIKECKKILLSIGIDEGPIIRLAVYYSY